MGIRVTCAKCRHTVDAPFAAAGEKANCPACGAPIKIPALAPDPATASSEPEIDVERVRGRLTSPATALIVIGTLMTALGCLGSFYRPPAVNPKPGGNIGSVRGEEVAPLFNCVGIILGPLIIFGAFQMFQLKSRGWGMCAAILAMLPCSLAWVLTFPFGLWAMIALSNREVKAYFDREA